MEEWNEKTERPRAEVVGRVLLVGTRLGSKPVMWAGSSLLMVGS